MWRLWAEITRGAKWAAPNIPVWQVWCSKDEALKDPGKSGPYGSRCVHEFIYPKGPNLRPSSQVPPLATEDKVVTSEVSTHLNPELVEGVLDYQGEWNEQPEFFLVRQEGPTNYLAKPALSFHNLFPFGKESPRRYPRARTVKNRVPIAVKASWFLINLEEACKDGTKAIFPYFDSAPDSVDRYDWTEWPTKKVLDLGRYCKDYPKYKAPERAVSLDLFHVFHVQDPEELDWPGGLAVLNGLHVATRETEDWVWGTFYWHPNPSHKFADGRPKDLPEPWSHYVMQVSTSQDDIIFNPYLEAGMGNGLRSNCMSCHRMAALGRVAPLGTHCVTKIENDAKTFKDTNTVLVDYLWSLAQGKKPWTCGDFPAPPGWEPRHQVITH